MSAVDRLLARSPVQGAARRRLRRRLVVLGYHGVDDPACFARQMDHLTEHMTPVTVHMAERALLTGAALPPNPVLVTFDDAEPSVLEDGLPIMRERGIPGVVFVIAGLVGTDRPYWWREVEALVAAGGRSAAVRATAPNAVVQELKLLPDPARVAAIEELRATSAAPPQRARQLAAEELLRLPEGGIELGNHTVTHPCLNRCAPGQIAAEIDGAGAMLRELLGAAPPWLAYPNGDYDRRVLAAARRSGVRLAFTYDHRSTPVPAPDPVAVSRLRVQATMPLDRFALVCTEVFPALLWARDRARAVRGARPAPQQSEM